MHAQEEREAAKKELRRTLAEIQHHAATSVQGSQSQRTLEAWAGDVARAADLLAQAPVSPSSAEIAARLAGAIQAFRNLPQLGRLVKLRATPAYSEMVNAWDEWRDLMNGGDVPPLPAPPSDLK